MHDVIVIICILLFFLHQIFILVLNCINEILFQGNVKLEIMETLTKFRQQVLIWAFETEDLEKLGINLGRV